MGGNVGEKDAKVRPDVAFYSFFFRLRGQRSIDGFWVLNSRTEDLLEAFGEDGVPRAFLAGAPDEITSPGPGAVDPPGTVSRTFPGWARVVDSWPRRWYSASGPVAQLAVQETFNL